MKDGVDKDVEVRRTTLSAGASLKGFASKPSCRGSR